MSLLDKLDQAAADLGPKKVPVGQYTVQVTDVEVKETPFDLKLSAELTVVDGEHKGQKVYWNTMVSDITSPTALGYIKGSICKMAGVESTSGDVAGTLSGAKGNTLKVEVVENPSKKDPSKLYRNVYIQEHLSGF